VTDGSDDGTPDLLQIKYNTVHHLQERNGKIGAMNRGMEKTPIVILVMLILTNLSDALLISSPVVFLEKTNSR
jgi:glycosyltransferase involved in cell wall biosynthesis